jgi:hypothetical protein
MKLNPLTLLLLVGLLCTPMNLASCDPDNVLDSKWFKNPVAVDGDVTFSNEWSDANKIELTIGTNYGRSPPFYDVTLWAKNDADHLYLLYCIKYDYINYDLSDTAYIYYLIPDEVAGLIFSDKSETSQLGSTLDLCEKVGSSWTNDLDNGGENNVEDMGHFDGVFFWFELKKPLNSGDGYDWILQYAEKYGFADSPIDKDEHLCIGMHDSSEGYDLQEFIQLAISSPDGGHIQSVGGVVEDISKGPVLFALISRIMAYSTLLVMGVWYIRDDAKLSLLST